MITLKLKIKRIDVFAYCEQYSYLFRKLERSDYDTMYSMGLDVRNKTISSWVEAYKLFRTSGLRYRRELPNNSLEINLQSHKSSVAIHRFAGAVC